MNYHIFQLKNSIQTITTILEQIESLNGEISPDLEKQLAISENTSIEQIQNISDVLDQLDTQINHFDSKIKALEIISERLERVKHKIESSLKDFMLSKDIKKLEGTDSVFSLVRSQPSLEIFNPDLVPENFCEIKFIRTPMKKIIKEASQNGELDISSFGKLTESYSLRKKVK